MSVNQFLPWGMAAPREEAAAGWRRRLGNVSAALRKRAVRPGELFGVFAALVGSQLGAAVLGLVFWTIAARALTPKEVGIGAALVAAMTLLSTFGVFGVGTLLIERFKISPITDRRALLSTGLSIALVGGALLTAGWLGVSALAHLSGALGHISLSSALLLIATTGLAAMCSVFDQAVIGMGASNVQLRRNLLASIVRIAVFCGAIELDMRGGQAILVSWALGLVGSLLATPLGRHLPPRARVTVEQRWHLVRDHWAAAIGHHGLTMAMGSSLLILPVVVASIVPATQMAYFASARMLADTPLMLPGLLTIALFATVDGTEGFRRKATRTMISGVAFAVFLIIAGALLGRVLLLMFGKSYSHESLPFLLLLLAAGPALVIKEHFVVLRRLQCRRTHGAVVVALWAAAELGGAVAGGVMGGLTMACVGWLVMGAACALTVLPVLIRAIQRTDGG